MSVVIKNLFLPSSFIMILILLGFLFYPGSRKKVGKILIILGITFYYLFSITPMADLLIGLLERDYSHLREEEMEEANLAVLLLGGREADVLRGSEALRISYFRDHDLKIIISGTNPLDPKRTDLSSIESFLVNRGVPRENLVVEDRSRNTWENVRNVKKKVEDKPFFLITSAYHMERSLREFERLNLSPIPAPTDFKARGGSYGVIDFIPGAGNLRRSDFAFYEFLGRIYYDLLGRF